MEESYLTKCVLWFLPIVATDYVPKEMADHFLHIQTIISLQDRLLRHKFIKSEMSALVTVDLNLVFVFWLSVYAFLIIRYYFIERPYEIVYLFQWWGSFPSNHCFRINRTIVNNWSLICHLWSRTCIFVYFFLLFLTYSWPNLSIYVFNNLANVDEAYLFETFLFSKSWQNNKSWNAIIIIF